MRSSVIAILIGLFTLVAETNAADLIVGAETTSGANRLFSFLTDGSNGNGTLDANYIALGGGAQGVTFDSGTNRIFATRGTASIAAFSYPGKTAVGGSPFTIPSALTSASLRNMRMKADNSGLLSAQFNSTPSAFGRVQTLSPTTPSTALSTTYSSVPSVHSVFQPSVGGFVYLLNNDGDITRFDDDGSNATTITLSGKVVSIGSYRDIYFVNPTTFFLSVRASSGGTGGVYKFTMTSASATTASLDTSWGSSGKALVSNAVGLAASSDGVWLYASANFTSPSNLSSMHSIRLSDAVTNTLMSNITGLYGYITVVPEPSTIMLACLGGIAAFMGRRFRRQAV